MKVLEALVVAAPAEEYERVSDLGRMCVSCRSAYMDACVRVAFLGWLTLDDVPLVEQALFVRLAVCEP